MTDRAADGPNDRLNSPTVRNQVPPSGREPLACSTPESHDATITAINSPFSCWFRQAVFALEEAATGAIYVLREGGRALGVCG